MPRRCNYWWVTRPKRKLNSIPEVLSVFAAVSLENQWNGDRTLHIRFEEELEKAKLKSVGRRRDASGSGGRTYAAWLRSLGLYFTDPVGKVYLTLAGQAIVDGKPPVDVLTRQVLEYQFPSAFSLSVGVDRRFRIKPFRFLLRLLMDDRLSMGEGQPPSLGQDEVGKIVCTEAESEKDYERMVGRLLRYREEGDAALSGTFFEEYLGQRVIDLRDPYEKLREIANTMFNWLEYTQLIARDKDRMFIPDEKKARVRRILDTPSHLVARPEDEETFQRRYGLDPWHMKDTRNLIATGSVSSRAIDVQRIRAAFIQKASKHPVSQITTDLVDAIARDTGADRRLVEDTLMTTYPHGAIGGFLANYYEMAFKGTDKATDFEKATTDLMRDVFHYDATHLGQTGSKSAPDILLISDDEGYQAIIDNKAYSRYSITGDHHNRMVHNYIGKLDTYSSSAYPLAFFAYVAGGFAPSIDKQLRAEVNEGGVHGSGITVSVFIDMIKKSEQTAYTHARLRDIFSLDRQITLEDIEP
ncbi:restriction endonuclease FokI C-terminal domain-containing protein [Pseudoscardovia suis]|uniref:Restriction endonuclease AlwI n=1 Tax=Pseudoscardovia suis TaxID=987063 RepID=A0A261EPN2_9BIFI|nr:restriction endonuclease FokI C-terminal domain-containing protein [Pseudoscardovia suis]OZG48818.1 restriction endonuclease AlwI [Pseudoscardovia suis]PJJ63962.1 restriction endonuclease FokI [Pseudoscardovia suis]